MRERLIKLKDKALEFWKSLNKNQQRIILASAGLMSLIILVLTVWIFLRTSTPEYKILFSDLTSEDASAIIENLKKSATPYQIAQGGRTILVPKKYVFEKRIELAASGFPARGVVGFEIFDQTRLGLTDFIQNVNYQRALEGELARTIMEIEEIEDARVKVVIPPPEIFIEKEEKTTASVIVKLKKNKTLDEDQVRAIVHLVAFSVKGLNPKDVTIVDSHANLLSEMLDEKKGAKEKAEITRLQLKQKEIIENQYQQKIQSALDKVLGPDKAVVRVTAELNFDIHIFENEVYEPTVDAEKGIVRSEQEIDEKYLGTGTVPEIGVPGTTSNIPGYKGLTEGTAEYKKSELTKNYEITKRVEKLEKSPGFINRISVAVMLDEESIPKTKIKEIQENVKVAANLDETRGDKVSVIAMKFGKSGYELLMEEQRREERHKRLMSYLYALLALAGIISLAFISYQIIKPILPKEEEKIEEIPVEEAVPLKEIMLPEISEEQRRREKIMEEVLKMINEDPEGAALIVRSWLFEE